MTKPEQAAEPISRTTLSGQVTERLRDGILAGAYRQGEQLNEAELARQFGVSRGPLREAMQRLIQAGLLETRPYRGVFVPELTGEDLADICFAREAIETAALRRVVSLGKAVAVSRRLAIEVDRMDDALRRGDGNIPSATTKCAFTCSWWTRRTAAACRGCTPCSSRRRACACTWW